MDLTLLKWTKNVRHPDADKYAYSEFKKVGELFKLAWKDDEADSTKRKDSANRPERNDLILLRQHGYVTHLVKVLNRQAEIEDGKDDYNIYRIVEVLWAIDCKNPPKEAKADAIFGFPEVLAFMGGQVMKLEELPTFRNAWKSDGLTDFQAHVQSKLAAISTLI